MQDKCSQDLTFDAVTTLGDATFFFRDRHVHTSNLKLILPLICAQMFTTSNLKAVLTGNVRFIPVFFFFTRYLWIKHNEQSDIKEGPISNFMPTIETSIDAAFWIPRRSTAYLISGNDVLLRPLYCIVNIKLLPFA